MLKPCDHGVCVDRDAGPKDAAFSCICDDGYVGKRTEQEQLNVCFDLF